MGKKSITNNALSSEKETVADLSCIQIKKLLGDRMALFIEKWGETKLERN